MDQETNFRIEPHGFQLNGEHFDQLSFIDICARTADRLNYWREAAIAEGLSEERIKASIAIDITPDGKEVYKADVLEFLNSLPPHSVTEINGDYFYISDNSERKDSDGTAYGFSAILKAVKRVLTEDGKFWITMPLGNDAEIRKAVRENDMQIKPIQFGYTGFWGGENKLFPKEGLPAVEPVTPHLKYRIDAVRESEENDPISAIFATKIGDYAYLSQNPVRYLVSSKKP